MTAIPVQLSPKNHNNLKTTLEASILARDCFEHLNAIALLAGTYDRQLSMTCGDITMLLNPVIEQMRLLTLMIEHNQPSAELRLVFDSPC